MGLRLANASPCPAEHEQRIAPCSSLAHWQYTHARPPPPPACSTHGLSARANQWLDTLGLACCPTADSGNHGLLAQLLVGAPRVHLVLLQHQ